MKAKNLLLSSFSLFGLLASCAVQAPTVDFFIYDRNDEFMGSLFSAFEAKTTQAGYRLSLYDGERKQTLQNAQVVGALKNASRNPLIVNIVDRMSASILIEKAEAADTPLLFVNRLPLSEDMNRSDWSKKNLYCVGADPEDQGRLQAEIARDYFGGPDGFKAGGFDKNGDGRIQTVLFRGEMSHQDTESRSKSVLDGLRDFGFDVDLVDVRYCDWERQEGYEAMRKIVALDESVELLLSNNDAMGLGAVDYLLENDPELTDRKNFAKKYFPIIGVDATADARAAIKEGTFIGTVLNDGEEQASLLLSLFEHFVKETPLPSGNDVVLSEGNYFYVKGKKIASINQE